MEREGATAQPRANDQTCFQDPHLNSPAVQTNGSRGSVDATVARVLCAPRLAKTVKRSRAKLETKFVDTKRLLTEAAEKLEGVRCERYMLKQLARMEYCLKCTPEELNTNILNKIDWYDHSMQPKKYIY